MKGLFYNIIGAAMEVHSQLGTGLLEAVYQEALSIELDNQEVSYRREVDVPIYYKGQLMQKTYRLDFLVNDVVVELKAATEILPEHRMQLFNYLRLTKKNYGLLINFGERTLHCERYILDEKTNVCYLVDRNLNKLI